MIWGEETKKRKPVAKNIRDFVRHKQGYKCKKCGSSLKRGGHLHHRNGDPSDNRFANLELVCTKCHKAKAADQVRKRAKERKKLLF
jgi:5-methylcytosine-specific restriction endonuclease McrA